MVTHSPWVSVHPWAAGIPGLAPRGELPDPPLTGRDGAGRRFFGPGGRRAPALGAAPPTALITSLLRSRARPSGHVFPALPEDWVPEEPGGPAPSIKAVCFCLEYLGVTHEISFAERIPLLSKMFAETTNKGHILTLPVQTINSGLQALDVRGAVWH